MLTCQLSEIGHCVPDSTKLLSTQSIPDNWLPVIFICRETVRYGVANSALLWQFLGKKNQLCTVHGE